MQIRCQTSDRGARTRACRVETRLDTARAVENHGPPVAAQLAMSTNVINPTAAHSGKVLGPGAIALDFRLPTTPYQFVSLGAFRGAPVILAFYPADWSPVCGEEVTLYNEILPEFRRFHAALAGISVDGPWCHV